MTKEELRILEVFEEVIPKLNAKERDRLLWIGEGLALKTKEQELEKK